MKIKKILSIALFVITLVSSIASLTGCSSGEKVPRPITKIDETSTDFEEGVAFKFGEYEIGIDMFMLYAIDLLSDFVRTFGEDCWTKDSIDLTWREAAPQDAFILYLTDILASSIACNVYFDETVGELDDSLKKMCSDTADERYSAFMEAGMPDGVISKDSLYSYTCSMYKLSYVVDELSKAYEDDQVSMQAAILGMRNSIDKAFDYDKDINWDLVRTIDYSLAIKDNGEGEAQDH